MSVVERVPATAAEIVSWEGERAQRRLDRLAVEEPLEIRLAGCSVSVTMRTPGDDLDLAAGFLFTEGIIHSPTDIASIAHCETDDAESAGNIVNVNPTDCDLVDPGRWRRNFFVTSSCGVCGKASIEAVRQEAGPITGRGRVRAEILYRIAEDLSRSQRVFEETGGLHAAGLFLMDGTPVVLREDVGRHNAVDKVIGHAFRAGSLPLDRHVLAVSGRASFEIMQKALMAGIPVVAAVSAPSSLAVSLARENGMTLAGFLRVGGGTRRFNVYAGEERIQTS
jgi:FdhD protein